MPPDSVAWRERAAALWPLSIGRAALFSAIVASAVYANAYRNGWAGDDIGVIRDNPAAHSIEAAWEARFEPYWPKVEGFTAGLYRPAMTMSYAIDWVLAGDSPSWFHVSNVLLHALVTLLVVMVAAAWLAPLGALAAGLVFAVHPVHVEAVANVVGRAELLAAAGLLTAVLAFRRYRRCETERAAIGWLAATLAGVLLALLAKEHGVVAVAILGLDCLLAVDRNRRPVGGVLVAVAALTLAWFVVWQAVAAQYVDNNTATTLRYLSMGERVATMLPVYLEIVRLLTLPLELVHDYNPQVIPQRLGFSPIALLGLGTVGAVLGLAAMGFRRAPAVSFGILAGVATYVPTANIVFAAGTLLGERTLYFAVIAPALAAGWLVVHTQRRLVALIVLGAFLLVYSARTYWRTPFWRSSDNVVIDAVTAHPENFRTHIGLGRALELTGDSSRALAEYLLAGSLYDRDPFVTMSSGPLALALGRRKLALREAQRAWALRPGHPAITGLLSEAYRANGQWDSALAVARQGVQLSPQSRTTASVYLNLLRRWGAPRWQLHLGEARLEWRQVRLAAATESLKAVAALIGPDRPLDDFCWEFQDLWPLIEMLQPGLAQQAQGVARQSGLDCGIEAGEESVEGTSG